MNIKTIINYLHSVIQTTCIKKNPEPLKDYQTSSPLSQIVDNHNMLQ